MLERAFPDNPQYHGDRDHLQWRHTDVIGTVAVAYINFTKHWADLAYRHQGIPVILEDSSRPIGYIPGDRGQTTLDELEGNEVCSIGGVELPQITASDFSGILNDDNYTIIISGGVKADGSERPIMVIPYTDETHAGIKGNLAALLGELLIDATLGLDGPDYKPNEMRRRLKLHNQGLGPDDPSGITD